MWFEKIVLEMYVYLKLGKLYKHHPHKPFFLVWQTSQSRKLPLLLFIIFFVWSCKEKAILNHQESTYGVFVFYDETIQNKTKRKLLI